MYNQESELKGYKIEYNTSLALYMHGYCMMQATISKTKKLIDIKFIFYLGAMTFKGGFLTSDKIFQPKRILHQQLPRTKHIPIS